MTPSGEAVFYKTTSGFVIWKTPSWSLNRTIGWNFITTEKKYGKQLTNKTMKLELSDRQRQLMTNLRDQ